MLIKDVEIINIFTNFAWIDTHTHTCYGFQIFLMNNSEEAVGKCLLTCSASNVKRIFSVFRRSRHREDRQTARDRGKDCKTLGHTDEWNCTQHSWTPLPKTLEGNQFSCWQMNKRENLQNVTFLLLCQKTSHRPFSLRTPITTIPGAASIFVHFKWIYHSLIQLTLKTQSTPSE